MRHISGNWLLDKIMSYLPQAPAAPGPPLDKFAEKALSDLITDFSDSIAVVEDVFNMIKTLGSGAFASSSSFSQTTFQSFLFDDVDQTVHDILVLLDSVADTLLDAIQAALAALGNLLVYQFQAVPVLGDLLGLLGIDTTLSVAHLISLVIAYPATLIFKLAVGGPLFPASTSQNRGLGDSTVPDPWGAALNWISGVTQFIWATNDGYLDCMAASNWMNDTTDEAPSFTTYLDILCPAVLSIAQWPSAPVDNKTPPPFSHFPADNESQALCPWIVVTGIAPWAAGIFGLGVGKTQDPDNVWGNIVMPWIQCACGAANGVLGAIEAWHEQASGYDKAEGILGNVSYFIAPTGAKSLADATEGVSLLVKGIVDAVGNYGASFCMFNDALTDSGC